MSTAPTTGTATTRLGALSIISALLLLAAGACDSNSPASTARSDPPPASTPADLTAPSSSDAAPPAAAASYRAVKDACRLLDDTGLADALGGADDERADPYVYDAALATTARCSRRYGTPDARSLVSAEITTIKSDTAQPMYDGMRGAQRDNPTVADVPGLGQGAYTYTDPQTGPHLAMYDGNLYLSIAVIGSTRPDTETERVKPMLAAAARSIADRQRQP